MPVRPGLSVCCLTGDPPAAVAASMSLLREVADEIVVAVDARVDQAELGPLLDVADRVVRFEFVDPPERSRPWLVELCRNPMVLMLDGDEVPSAALVDALPSLVAEDHIQQVQLARRWCFPDERTWLAERPWWPDFQRRLFRRGPGLDLDVRFHGGVRPASPSRAVEASMYHLVAITRPIASRRARAREYDHGRPGVEAVGGGAMNDILYAPERFATRRPVATPPDDLVALRAVLGAPTRRAARPVALPVVTAAEIATHVPPGPLEGIEHELGLRIVEVDLRTDPASDTSVLVEISNDSARDLPWQDGRGVELRLATRILHPDGHVGDQRLTTLPCDVPAGQARLVDVVVSVPPTPGRFGLEVTLLNQRGGPLDVVDRADLEVTTRWGRFALDRPRTTAAG